MLHADDSRPSANHPIPDIQQPPPNLPFALQSRDDRFWLIADRWGGRLASPWLHWKSLCECLKANAEAFKACT